MATGSQSMSRSGSFKTQGDLESSSTLLPGMVPIE